jgi:hypothetical protein
MLKTENRGLSKFISEEDWDRFPPFQVMNSKQELEAKRH